MADNIAITAGSGTTVRTDDVSGVHYQVVKLADGTDDGTALIAGDATNGLDVDVTRIIPGTAATNLGKAEDAQHTSGDVGVAALAVRADTAVALAAHDNDYAPLEVDATGHLHVVPAATELHLGAVGVNTIAIDVVIASAAAAYASGDMVGAELTLTNIARVNGGTGKITGVNVIDYAAQSAAFELWIFDTAVTEPADNAAWTLSDAEMATNVTVISSGSFYASALNSVAPIPNLSIPYKCTAATRDLKLCFVTRGAPTCIANGYLVRIIADQD